jgi:hypothetical protein
MIGRKAFERQTARLSKASAFDEVREQWETSAVSELD